MSSKPSAYQVQEKMFEMYCEDNNLTATSFSFNPKNNKQFFASCFSAAEGRIFILISENGKYYKYFSKGDWRPIL